MIETQTLSATHVPHPRSEQVPRSERSTNGSPHDDGVQGGCRRYCPALPEMTLRTLSPSRLMPIRVRLFVATFDPTVE